MRKKKVLVVDGDDIKYRLDEEIGEEKIGWKSDCELRVNKGKAEVDRDGHSNEELVNLD
jgi:hypothetical protein